MKTKRFFTFAACLVAMAAVICSCEKKPIDGDDDDDGDIIVVDDDDFDALLEGEDYVILKAGQSVVDALGSKVIVDLRPDDVNVFLYDWAGGSFGAAASGLDAFGYAEDWQPLVAGGAGWAGVGLFVNNDTEHGGTQMQDFVNAISGQESEYTLVVVTKIDSETDDPWLQIYGFGAEHAEVALTAECAADGEWHAIQMNCADLGTLSIDNLKEGELIKSNLYGYGITNGTANC